MTIQKNQIDLLKIINILKNKVPVRLLIIGSGNQKSYLEKYIVEKKLSKFIKILPYKKNPYVYFKKSNIFLLTSIYEGLPNVLLEATLFKNLCISYNCKTGPKEILANGKGGILVNTFNYKKIASEILEYYATVNKKHYYNMVKTSSINLINYNCQSQLVKYEKLISFYLNK